MRRVELEINVVTLVVTVILALLCYILGGFIGTMAYLAGASIGLGVRILITLIKSKSTSQS